MKKILVRVALGASVILLSSCFGQHNEAPSEGVNLDSERVYGVRGGEPKQLANQYPDPTPETLERIENIRNKMFPE